MAASSWPEVADNARAQIPLTDLRVAFWLVLAVAIGATLLHIKRLLKAPPTAAEIASELDALNKGTRRASTEEVEAAVHRGINGTAERIKEIMARVEKIDEMQDKNGERLARLEGRVDDLIVQRTGRR